jgi:hypothetical protein
MASGTNQRISSGLQVVDSSSIADAADGCQYLVAAFPMHSKPKQINEGVGKRGPWKMLELFDGIYRIPMFIHGGRTYHVTMQLVTFVNEEPTMIPSPEQVSEVEKF